MEVYLTFDDGLQAGTEEVLAVLNSTKVRATFFLVGANIADEFSRNFSKSSILLKDIFENHFIGNHSYSHANEHYADYYKRATPKDSQNTAIPSLHDFELNRIIVYYYLKEIYRNRLQDKRAPEQFLSQPKIARLPGRNTWRLNLINEKRKQLSRCIDDLDTKEVADELSNLGYQIFGWDTEWSMAFDFAKEFRQHGDNKSTKDVASKASKSYCNMYSKEHEHKDRIIENSADVLRKIMNIRRSKRIIILLHDRAFRSRKSFTTCSTADFFELPAGFEARDLETFISNCQELGMNFKTLDHYFK